MPSACPKTQASRRISGISDCYSKPALIGGASRSGKTALALALRQTAGPIAGFPLEAVFHVYYRRMFPFFITQRQRIVSEYLNRPRYISEDRLQTASPKDYMGKLTDQLEENIPSSITHQISLLGWILDQFSKDNNCTTWAAFDLHPEFFYARYRKHLPDLRLAIMQRDPYSAISAGVFWRSWPEAPPDRETRFRLMLALWLLSKVTSETLAKKYPTSVSRFSFNRLCNGDHEEYARLANFFPLRTTEIKKAFDFVPHFYFHKKRGFLTPGGGWENLLTPGELEEINNLEQGVITDPLTRFLLRFGAKRPELARKILEAYLYPTKTIRRKTNSIRQLIIDTRAGVRLRLYK